MVVMKAPDRFSKTECSHLEAFSFPVPWATQKGLHLHIDGQQKTMPSTDLCCPLATSEDPLGRSLTFP